MPKVRASSATMGTTRGPMFLSRKSEVRIRTKAMVVDSSRSPLLLSCVSNADSGGAGSGSALRRRRGSPPPNSWRRCLSHLISGLSSGGR